MNKLTLLIALAVSGLSLLGCSAKAPLPVEPEAAVAEVKKWVPEGTAAEVAEATMTKAGFYCARKLAKESGKAFLLCLTDDGGRLVKRRWNVSMEVRDEKIVAHQVTIDLVGL